MHSKIWLVSLLGCFLAASIHAQVPSAAPQTQEPVLPYIPSLDLASMDQTADPCANFYQYSCGGWKKNNPIPPDQSSWDVYRKLYEDNLNYLRSILEEAAAPDFRTGTAYPTLVRRGVSRRGAFSIQHRSAHLPRQAPARPSGRPGRQARARRWLRQRPLRPYLSGALSRRRDMGPGHFRRDAEARFRRHTHPRRFHDVAAFRRRLV